MALFNALMRYKTEGRLLSFDMHGDKKSTVKLAGASSFVIYMSTDYIIGEAEIKEASMAPMATYVIYNDWDRVSQSAFKLAKRLKIEICTFGAFGHRLDALNP